MQDSTTMAMMIITVSKDLPKLVDEVHDKYFDLDKLKRENLKGSVTLAVAARQGDLSGTQAPLEAITVHHVVGIEIKDTAMIGYYDINEIDFDSARKRLRITCGAPAEVTFLVNDLKISYSRQIEPQKRDREC